MQVARERVCVLLVLTIAFVSLVPLGVRMSRAEMLQPHAPILISGNSGFTPENGVTRGSGTVSEPYVIEDLEIASAPGPAIRVNGTNAHFLIRHLYVHSSLPLSGFVGVVEFEEVANGLIEDVTLSNNSRYAGIHVRYSTNITISHNRIESNEANAIGVEFPRNVTITSNLVRSNLGGIFVTGVGTSYSEIVGNDVSSNRDFGISVTSSSDVVSGNNVDNNGQGIIAIRRCNCLVTGNTVSNNRVGIAVNNGPTVFHNNLINNTIQADSGCPYGPCTQLWDNGYPSGGNFWSDSATIDNCSGPNQDKCPDHDGVVDYPRLIGYGGVDRYPLTKPFAPAVLGEVKFEPSSIMAQDVGRHLTALVRLPEGYEAPNLVLSSVRLNGTISVANGLTIGQRQGQRDATQHERGVAVLVLRFNTTQIRALMSKPGAYSLRVSGNLLTPTNFRPFEATATFRLLSLEDT